MNHKDSKTQGRTKIFTLCVFVSLCLSGSSLIAQDSISLRPIRDTGWRLKPGIPLQQQILDQHPWLGFDSKPEIYKEEIRQFNGKELIFYVLIGLLIVYGLFRQAFPKYFNDLLRVFFRTTIKQRQVREQMIQTPLPSLLLNGLFVISAGMYLSFILQYFNMSPAQNFWLMTFYCIIGLSGIYLVKFLGLKFSGWLFNMKESAESYIFIVFITNKMVGIVLLPFLVLLAFGQGALYAVSLTLSWCVIGCIYIYRFILTYTTIRNQIKLNPFHFFLYLLAFEIAPLLLVYKGLLLFLRITT